MKTEHQISTINGKINAIDPQARTLTVAGLVMNKTFQVAPGAGIATASKPQAALTDLKVGDEVDVTYEEHESVSVALRVIPHGAHSQQEEFRKAA